MPTPQNEILQILIPGCIIGFKFQDVKGGINIEKAQKYYLNKSSSDYDIRYQSHYDQLLKIV